MFSRGHGRNRLRPTAAPAEIFRHRRAARMVDPVTLAAFVLFVILGGAATVAMRYSFSELPPFWGAAVRFALAALIMWLLALLNREPIPRGRSLLGAVLFGALSVGAAFIFLYWGLVKTPASLFQTIIALVPLLTLFFAVTQSLERLQLRGVIGSLLSLAGIVVALGDSGPARLSWPHLLAVVAGAACMAAASVVGKRFPQSNLLSGNAVAMTVGAGMLGVAALVAREPRVWPASTGVWLAFIYLILGASVAWFLLYLFLLDRWTASATAYGFVLTPIVTAILATWLIGEQIGWRFAAGGIVVLAGVWIGALQQPHGDVT